MDKKKKPLDIVKQVKKDLSKYRKNFETLWEDEEDAYYGKIWKNTPEFRPYENMCFQIVESEVPILSDSYPGVAVKVTDPEFLEQSKILQKGIDWVLESQNFQIKFPNVVRKSLISAPSYLHPYYDANAKNGEGENRIEQIDWRFVWLSGNSEYIEDCDKARIELKRSREWLKLNYKNFTKEIENQKPDIIEKSERDHQLERFDSMEYARRKKPAMYQDDDMLKLVKTYIRDYSLEEIPQEETIEDIEKEKEQLAEGMSPDINLYEDHNYHIEAHSQEIMEIFAQVGAQDEESFQMAIEQILAESPESGVEELVFKVELLKSHIEEHQVLQKENPKGGRPKYKNGLRVIETLEDKTVLYDGPSQDDHAEIPLVPFYAYRDGTIYGYGEIRNIIDSERMKAELQYKEYEGLRKVANPGLIVDEESGLTEDDITNEDGAIYVLPQGTNVRYLQPGSVSPQIGQFNQDRKRSILDISGVNEATQGKMPAPNAAAYTVEKINQQAVGRIRLKDRQNQRYSIKRLGKLLASNIIQYWTNDKVLYLTEEGDQIDQIVFNPIGMQELEYEVEISEGSMAGIDKDSYNAMLFNLLNAGQITLKDILELGDIPKAKKLKAIVAERENTEAQLQQMQQENILLKGQYAPQSLTEEEAEIFAQLQSEAQMTPNDGQV
jgi:hypothetical protein